MAVTGFEADPDQVTELLQIAPTMVARKGTIAPSGRPHHSNGWWFEVSPPKLRDGAGHNIALSLLIDRLRDSEGRFERLRKVLEPTSITIYGGLYVQLDEQCGVWLDPEQMRVLSVCGIGWGMDIFLNDEVPKAVPSS